MTKLKIAIVVAAAWLVASCGDGGGATEDGGRVDARTGGDAGMRRDSSVGVDSGPGMDSGAGTDSGPGMDSGTATDSGTITDSGPAIDAGPCIDPPPGPDRPTAPTCSPCRPDFPPPPPLGVGCDEHSDCTDGPNGRCVLGMIGAFCSYDECFTDDDCEPGEVCSCDGALIGGGNTCVPSNCRTNADCTSGICAPSYTCLLGGPPGGWYCRTTADECSNDTECATDPGGRCAFDESRGLWACEFGICVF